MANRNGRGEGVPDDGLTDRSRRFYNGTYQFEMEGFTDEHGIYRAFNLDEPNAQPPTPNPPRFSDSEDEGPSNERPVSPLTLPEPNIGLRVTAPRQSLSSSSNVVRGGGDVPTVNLVLAHQNLVEEVPSTGSEGVDVGDGYYFPRTAPRETLFSREDGLVMNEGESRERALGRHEGILIGQWHGVQGLDLEGAYKQVGVPYPDSLVEAMIMTTGRIPSAVPWRAIQREVHNGDGRSSAITTGTPIFSSLPTRTRLTLEIDAGGDGQEGVGEPETSPFSNISGMTDVSDPPSEVAEPEPEVYEATMGVHEASPGPQSRSREADTTPAKSKKQAPSSPVTPLDAGKHNDKKNLGAGDNGNTSASDKPNKKSKVDEQGNKGKSKAKGKKRVEDAEPTQGERRVLRPRKRAIQYNDGAAPSDTEEDVNQPKTSGSKGATKKKAT